MSMLFNNLVKVFCLSFLVLLAFSFFAGLASAAISSEEASNKAKYYLNQGEQLEVSEKLTVEQVSYWTVYFYLQNDQDKTRNLLVAINEQTGEIVSDPVALTKIHGFDFRLSKFNSFTSDSASMQQISNWFDSFKVFLSNLNNPSSKTSFAYIQSSLGHNYSSLDLGQAQLQLDAIATAATTLEEELERGTEAQQEFDQVDHSLVAFNKLLTRYNSTMKDLVKLQERADRYDEELIQALQSVSPSQYQAVSSQLMIIEIPESLSKELTRLSSKQKQFDSFFVGEEEYANDSVQSFLYRKEYIEKSKAATALYSEMSARVTSIIGTLAQKQAYSACGVEVKEIETAWAPIKAFFGSGLENKAADYAKKTTEMESLRTVVDAAETKYFKCLSPTPTSKPKTEELDYKQFALPAIIIVLLVAAFLFLKRKEKKGVEAPAAEEESTAPSIEDQPTGKSLW